MENKQIKICSTPHTIQQLQIERGYHYTSTSIAKIQNTTTGSTDKDVQQQELSPLLVEMQNGPVI